MFLHQVGSPCKQGLGSKTPQTIGYSLIIGRCEASNQNITKHKNYNKKKTQ